MTPDIRQKLDKITDTMWSGGLANPITYVEQLSYLLYLKLLDEAENQHTQAELLGITLDRPTLFPAQAKRYRWSEWRFRSGRDLLDFIADEVFPYMASLVREAPAVATFFADARFQFDVAPNLIAVAGSAAIAMAAGWLASFRILDQKPLEILRDE